MGVLFTADNHFGHDRIRGHCGRPFNTLQEMNQCMIDRWNFVVRPSDIVMVAGDFAFGRIESVAGYLSLLRGRKILITGNHDRHSRSKYLQAGFSGVFRQLKIGQIWITHRPEPIAPENSKVVLCGHVHDRWSVKPPCINVGVDVRQFYPVTLDQIGLSDDLMEGVNLLL